MIEEIRENIDATATGRRIRELRDLKGLRRRYIQVFCCHCIWQYLNMYFRILNR